MPQTSTDHLPCGVSNMEPSRLTKSSSASVTVVAAALVRLTSRITRATDCKSGASNDEAIDRDSVIGATREEASGLVKILDRHADTEGLGDICHSGGGFLAVAVVL